MKKVAIITGGSGGIGAATAALLAQNDYNVCIHFHSNEKKAFQLQHEIRQLGGTAIAIKADLAKESEIISLFNTVDKELGPVTALINNAGINGGTCKVEDLNATCLETVFSTNVFATFYCCREAINRMKKQQIGRIVNISSEAARFGGTQMAHYAASKAAINTLTIALAREVGAYNITVNAISPGIINTEMSNHLPADRLETLKKSIPLGRMGHPLEVAESIRWLLSNKASYLNGAIIPITGGR